MPDRAWNLARPFGFYKPVSVIYPDSGLEPALPRAATLRLRLREATAGAHARLDGRLGALDLKRLDDYRRFLEANAAAVLPIEQALERSGVADVFPDWPMRSRRSAMMEDLRRVNGHPVTLQYAGMLDPGELLGTMYVLEGSRLGAQFLLRTVTQSPDPKVAETVAYLGHGAGQPLWKSFLSILERQAAHLDDQATAIHGAQRAFALFERAAAST